MSAPSRPRQRGRLYTFKSLSQKGIDYSKNHIRRLVSRGEFPRPIYLSERVPAWTEEALDAWIQEKVEALDERGAA